MSSLSASSAAVALLIAVSADLRAASAERLPYHAAPTAVSAVPARSTSWTQGAFAGVARYAQFRRDGGDASGW